MSSAKTFEDIYMAGGWDGMGSGPGSTEEFTREFRGFLRRYLNRPSGRIIDLGCGDWQWQRHSTFPHGYSGIDCVQSVIDTNRASYLDHEFLYGNVLASFSSPITSGNEIFLVKDVLHHMSENEASELVVQLQGEHVIWVVDVTEDGAVIGPNPSIQRLIFEKLPVAFEFERPESYRYGRKVVMIQRRG